MTCKQIPVLVINLRRNSERRRDISCALNELGISFNFFEAIDGGTLGHHDGAKLCGKLIFDRPLTNGEIGCAASHIAVLNRIAKGPDPFVCVIEDDAEITDGLAEVLRQKMPQFDALRLVSDPHRYRFFSWKVGEIGGRHLYAMARPGWGTQAQIWSRDGAIKALRYLCEIRAPIDFAIYHDCHARGMKVLEMRPGVVAHDRQFENGEWSKTSDIGNRDFPTERSFRRRLIRLRRRYMAAKSFVLAWGIPGLARLVLYSRPGKYFR